MQVAFVADSEEIITQGWHGMSIADVWAALRPEGEMNSCGTERAQLPSTLEGVASGNAGLLHFELVWSVTAH